MRPAALALNILVASFTSFPYVRAGLFRWRTVWPFLSGAIPFAFFGGAIQLPGTYSRPLVGAVLLIGGARLLWPSDLTTNREPHDPPIWIGVRRHQFPIGADRHRRRHIPIAITAVPRMVRYQTSVRRGRGVHPLQLDCGPAWQRRHCEGVAA